MNTEKSTLPTCVVEGCDHPVEPMHSVDYGSSVGVQEFHGLQICADCLLDPDDPAVKEAIESADKSGDDLPF